MDGAGFVVCGGQGWVTAAGFVFAGAAGALPLIVHIHGGVWRGGSKYPCPFLVLVNRGYAVASIEYRFSQKAIFPGQMQDCRAAIRRLRGSMGWMRARWEWLVVLRAAFVDAGGDIGRCGCIFAGR